MCLLRHWSEFLSPLCLSRISPHQTLPFQKLVWHLSSEVQIYLVWTDTLFLKTETGQFSLWWLEWGWPWRAHIIWMFCPKLGELCGRIGRYSLLEEVCVTAGQFFFLIWFGGFKKPHLNPSALSWLDGCRSRCQLSGLLLLHPRGPLKL